MAATIPATNGRIAAITRAAAIRRAAIDYLAGSNHRPARRCQHGILARGQRREAADVEGTRAVIARSAELRMFDKNVVHRLVCKTLAEAHSLRDFGKHPPVRL